MPPTLFHHKNLEPEKPPGDAYRSLNKNSDADTPLFGVWGGY
jgi:hypothetical protein